MDLNNCETAAMQMLEMLPDCDRRTSIIRSGLVAMESDDNSGTDYKRYHLILSIYLAEPSKLLCRYDYDDSPPPELLSELVKIRQRKDTLHILASYFQGDKLQRRPMLHKFFRSLGTNDQTDTSETTESSLSLGLTVTNDFKGFDALTQIGAYFRETQDYSAVSALAPLCTPPITSFWYCSCSITHRKNETGERNW
jgi:hypothetical protein